jgi:hypothetical protein
MQDKIYTQDEIQDLIEELQTLTINLGEDYQRLSRSGKDAYDDLCMVLNIE